MIFMWPFNEREAARCLNLIPALIDVFGSFVYRAETLASRPDETHWFSLFF